MADQQDTLPSLDFELDPSSPSKRPEQFVILLQRRQPCLMGRSTAPVFGLHRGPDANARARRSSWTTCRVTRAPRFEAGGAQLWFLPQS